LIGAGAFLSGTTTLYDNFTQIVDDPMLREQLTHRMTLGVGVGDSNQSTYNLPLPAPGPLPDYLGVSATSGVTVPITTSSVSSYGKKQANIATAGLTSISSYGKDGPIIDATASLVPIIDPAATTTVRLQQLAEVKSF